MNFKILLILPLLILFRSIVAQDVPSPKDFLGYEPGEQFTLHHRVVEYFKTVADASSSVQLQQYGTSYEGRPLYVAYISTPGNLQRLEEIRINNLRMSGLESGKVTEGPAIVWLSYNVHGNESSSTEAAMKTLYELINRDNAEASAWLQNVVVIMDPCINPDGRDRYVNYFKQYQQIPLQTKPYAMSHQEDWPGGRVNHYLFDLNRDWLWLSQKESQERLDLYNKWLPQIHVDFHEQSPNSPYYFAPGAEPYHSVITSWQRNFQKEIGANHARYFDKNNWAYFTGEVFDLLYPSYGDTYPTFNGAIGMTYEQAGGGSAGLAVATEYGDTLTLKDRVEHHFTTGMSTVEIASENSVRLLDEYQKYFREAPGGTYKAFVIPGTNNPYKLEKLISLLDAHKIRYGTSSYNRELNGFHFNQGTNSLKLTSKDLVIPVNQPKGRLVRAMFEPDTYVADTLTYDITAWSLPYALGLEAMAVEAALTTDGAYTLPEMTYDEPETPAYAYLINYESLGDGIFLGALLQAGIETGVLNKPATHAGQRFERGTLVVMKSNNAGYKNLDAEMSRLARKHKVNLTPVKTGLATNGIDLGSGNISRIMPPRVGLVAGPGTSVGRVGEVWHFFEKQFSYPLTLIRAEDISPRVLGDFDVLIMNEGAGDLENLLTWIREGGKVIAMGDALAFFDDAEDLRLSEKTVPESPDSLSLSDYAARERKQLSEEIPGAIFRIRLDNTHPLAYGYPSHYETLTIGTDSYQLPYGNQVGLMDANPKPLNGFAGHKALEKISGRMVFGVERYGQGNLVYMSDNPLFRSFWENGKLLFINAVLQVN